MTTSIFGKNSQHDWGALNSVLGGSLIDWMRSFTTELKAFDNYKGTWATLWGLLDNRTLSGIDKRLGEQFSADNIAGLQTFVSEMVAAIRYQPRQRVRRTSHHGIRLWRNHPHGWHDYCGAGQHYGQHHAGHTAHGSLQWRSQYERQYERGFPDADSGRKCG